MEQRQENNKLSIKGIVIGIIATILACGLMFILIPRYSHELALLARLKLAISCLVLPGLLFLIMILNVGRQRFGNKAENPVICVANNNAMQIDIRVLANTHEQLTVFMISTFALAVMLPFAYLNFVPICAALFFIGRVVFWVGYRCNALYRGPGFALTMFPSLFALVFCAAKIIFKI